MTTITANGVVHGKTIEFEQSLDLPDGQPVSVRIQPSPTKTPTGEKSRAFGAWSDDPEGVDRFVEEVRKQRDIPSTRDLNL